MAALPVPGTLGPFASHRFETKDLVSGEIIRHFPPPIIRRHTSEYTRTRLATGQRAWPITHMESVHQSQPCIFGIVSHACLECERLFRRVNSECFAFAWRLSVSSESSLGTRRGWNDGFSALHLSMVVV